MCTFLAVLVVFVLLWRHRRNAPRRDDNSFEWQVRYATRAVIGIVLISVLTALWLG